MSTLQSPPQFAELAEINFASGLPGFSDAHHFSCSSWGGEDSPFTLLSSQEIDSVHFVTVDPTIFFPRYLPPIDIETLSRVGLRPEGVPTVLVILTLGLRPEEATANLLGPLIINPATGAAIQAVLTGTTYATRALLAGAMTAP